MVCVCVHQREAERMSKAVRRVQSSARGPLGLRKGAAKSSVQYNARA